MCIKERVQKRFCKVHSRLQANPEIKARLSAPACLRYHPLFLTNVKKHIISIFPDRYRINAGRLETDKHYLLTHEWWAGLFLI